MTYIIALEEDADREAFINDMKSEGVSFEEFDALPRLFSVPDGYNHPSIQFCDDGDAVATSAGTLYPTFQTQDWGMFRNIRRDRPYNLRRFAAPKVMRNTAIRTGLGVDIYVIDGRIVDHAEFTGRFTVIYDGVSGEIYSHGNEVSSCAAGGNMGVAPEATLWSCAVFGSNGLASTSTIIAGINAAVSHYQGRAATNRPAVLTTSLSSTASTVGTAAIAAIAAGIVVTAAAGNEVADVSSPATYPAISTGVICVGGINAVDSPYYQNGLGSNYGTRVDVLAPSQVRWLAKSTGFSDYLTGSGTSYGSPSVAGAAALMLQGHGRLADATDVAKIRTKIVANATTGRLQQGAHPNFANLPDKILYVDPDLAFEEF